MDKVLVVDPSKCTGCRICEMVCSMAKLGEYKPSASYIRVLKNKEMDINMVALGIKCDYCGKCVEWCLPGAIKLVSKEEAIIKWKGVKVGSLPAPLLSNL